MAFGKLCKALAVAVVIEFEWVRLYSMYTGQATKKDRRVKRQSKCNSITVSTIRQYAVKLKCRFITQFTLFFFQPDAI